MPSTIGGQVCPKTVAAWGINYASSAGIPGKAKARPLPSEGIRRIFYFFLTGIPHGKGQILESETQAPENL